MKKIMFFIAIIVCFVTSVNAQIISQAEWKKLAYNAKLIHSYNEINENDSILFLYFAGHNDFICCKKCISYMRCSNMALNTFDYMKDVVDHKNVDEVLKDFGKTLKIYNIIIKAWDEHLNSSECKRRYEDKDLYVKMLLYFVNDENSNRITECKNTIWNYID